MIRCAYVSAMRPLRIVTVMFRCRNVRFCDPYRCKADRNDSSEHSTASGNLAVGLALQPRPATSVQVRIFSPGLGVLKGMLTLKEGIEKIQYLAPRI